MILDNLFMEARGEKDVENSITRIEEFVEVI